MKIRYSELFFSFQGEGNFVGVPCVWIRLHGCNLECNGFGQTEPTNPDTWELPYKNVNLINIKDVTELPVFDKGCDSSYTWSKQYRHLMQHEDVDVVADKIINLLPTKTFTHKDTKQAIHLAITGGEPMMNQPALVELIKTLRTKTGERFYIQIETNGTRPLKQDFVDYVRDYGIEIFFNVSPKLFSVSGESNERAIKPDVVKSYIDLGMNTCLKFVVNGTTSCWDELESVIDSFNLSPADRYASTVYVMGVGGTLEGLKTTEADIASEAIKRGYYYTSRVHVHVYGNSIGT